MCGFGEKVDRRPVDPPPIIQLFFQRQAQPEEPPFVYNPNFFLYASLIGSDTEEEFHLLRDGKTRSTAGSIVSSLFRLKDTEGREGAFFVFPDLSVRREGSYRLKVNKSNYSFHSLKSSIPIFIFVLLQPQTRSVYSPGKNFRVWENLHTYPGLLLIRA
jgi:hypothetical protein